jgi:hypothetical protein
MVRSARFQFQARVEGQLPTSWSVLLAGLQMALDPDGTTLISGELADQAAVHGLLDAIRDLGLSLVSVEANAGHRSSSPSGG